MRARIATGIICFLAASCGPRAIELGFWVEPVSFSSVRIGGPISSGELAAIETIARAEVVKAFQHLDVIITSNRRARYKVAVVQRLNDQRVIRTLDVAGESRATSFGGSGAVSFDFVASGATVFAPDSVARSMIIEAIGRAAGRVAVHEFAHQLVPRVAIHDSRDPGSYEYGSTSREQYFGEMHWDIAGPALDARIGRRGHGSAGR